MQSWANSARGAARPTHTRPTKAGVIGLVANALGRNYTDPIDDLADLRFGVRIDRPGTVETDYHTTGSGQYYALPTELAHAPSWWGNVHSGDPSDPDWMTYAPAKDITEGKNGGYASSQANPNITTDHYLADASFLAALQSPYVELIHQIAAALAAPARAVYLGRKAYGPAAPLLETLAAASIEELFAATAPTDGLSVYLEPAPGALGGTVVHDQPVTFNGPTRRAARLESHYILGSAARSSPAMPAPDVTLLDELFTQGQNP